MFEMVDIGDQCRYGFHTFEWTDQHLSRDKIRQLKQEHDRLGDAVLQKLERIVWPETKLTPHALPDQSDLYAALRAHRDDAVIGQFWQETHNVPDWVDWEQVGRGQRVFYRYFVANSVGFALQGFLGDNSATLSTVEVLSRTGSFAPDKIIQRLRRTFQWLLQVAHNVEAVVPGGIGHTSTIRVRLLHASVRRQIMRLAKSRFDYYDYEVHGIPINTLDSIHAHTVFSCNPMWLQLPALGIRPAQREKDDFLAFHRWLAYVLGVPSAYLPRNTNSGRILMESFLIHELHATPKSQQMATSFIHSLKDLPPFGVSRAFLEAGGRYMNDDRLCDALGMGATTLRGSVSFLGFQWAVSCLSMVQRVCPAVDTYVVERTRDALHRLMDTPGWGSSERSDIKSAAQPGKVIVARTSLGGLGKRPFESICIGCFALPCLLTTMMLLTVLL